MLIFVVAMGYPTEKYRGNGIFEFDQAKALSSAGHKVVFIAIDLRSIRRWRKWGFESFFRDGVEIRAINWPVGRVPGFLLLFIGKLAAKFLYKKVVKEFGRPEIVHAHFTDPASFLVEVVSEDLTPFVITEHSSVLNQDDSNLKLKAIIDYTYSRADKIIAVSPALRGVIKKVFGYESVYIPNVVDTKLFKYSPSVEKQDFQFISVGALILSKRMDLTVDAFSNSFGTMPNAKLIIIGEGPEREKIEKLIVEKKLQKQVFLLGMQSREFIAKCLRQSDCFVLSSRTETFGVVYIEAMACGLPVIATMCKGPEHFVNDKNGILIPIDDCEALADAMFYMFQNRELYDSIEISKQIDEAFSENALVKKLMEIYQEVSYDRNY